jgi:hypothetical protein
VLLDDRAVVGTAVPAPPEDHLLLHRGGGAVASERRSWAASDRFAEEEARRRGREEIRAFINLTIANEIRLCRARVSSTIGAADQEGYVRVFLRERLA